MKLKDIYNPDKIDILAWVNDEADKWPVSDWDYYVLNGNNDELILNLANEVTCQKRGFFVHSLYYLVGIYFNESIKDENKKSRILKLIGMVSNNTSVEVKRWKQETLDLFSQKTTFDPYYWLNYMFQ
ncbi:hypothetical protein [Bacteroides sp. 519]|uniref:hypothetical protein n=1 Tax=Bacteroides sp. 519 TaxID=2302937 RepID=UPI0013D6A436|nr:hypothetical protein [Bacteroides sp. 519]NDV60655.1 hypothetical protein [Bacteroides sp. 519]